MNDLERHTIAAIKRAAAMLPMLSDRDKVGFKTINEFADELNELRIELDSALGMTETKAPPDCKCGHGYYTHLIETTNACSVGDCPCEYYEREAAIPALAGAGLREALEEVRACASLHMGENWMISKRVMKIVEAALAPEPIVTDRMQGVDYPYCEDGTPHSHAALRASPKSREKESE